MPDLNPTLDPGNPEARKPKGGFEVGAESLAKNNPNQDALLADEQLGVYAVFDGAGGHEGGDVAANVGRDTLREQFRANPNADLKKVTQKISQEIGDNTREGVTTAAIVHTLEYSPIEAVAKVEMTTVGDSRVYIIGADGEFRGVTIDNVSASTSKEVRDLTYTRQTNLSTATELKHLSEEDQRAYNRRNVIAEYLGQGKDQDPAIYQMDIREGDIVLITSDGVHDNLTDAEILAIVRQNNGLSAQEIASRVANAARDRAINDSQHFRAKPDDTTALVLRYSKDMPSKVDSSQSPRSESGPNATSWLADLPIATRPEEPTAQQPIIDAADVPKASSAEWQEGYAITFKDFTEGKLRKQWPEALRSETIPFPVTVELGDTKLELSALTDDQGKLMEYVLAVPGKSVGDYLSGKYIARIPASMNPESEGIVFGRGQASSTELGLDDDPHVSRSHLKIKTYGGIIEFTDLSANGTEIRKNRD